MRCLRYQAKVGESNVELKVDRNIDPDPDFPSNFLKGKKRENSLSLSPFSRN
jgi:hypothetical protein